MCQITRRPFSPSAALCFPVEVKGKKGKLKGVYIVYSTHQDAYLRIKHKVLFSLTYITVFAKLQSSSYFSILTKECLIGLVGWIKRAKKIHMHVLQYVLKGWKQNTENLAVPWSPGEKEVMSLYLIGLKGNVLTVLQRSCIWLMRPSRKKLGEYIVKAVLYGSLRMLFCRQQLLATERHKMAAGHRNLVSSDIVCTLIVSSE